MLLKNFGPNWVHKRYKDYHVQDMTNPVVLRGRKYRKLVERAQRAAIVQDGLHVDKL